MELPADLCIGRSHLIAHQAVAEQHLERRPLLHHRAHGQDRVEPVAELAREAFGDEVGREPLLPLGAIAVVAHRRIRHDAGVEPRIADIGDARHQVAASSDCGSSPGRSTADAACGPRICPSPRRRVPSTPSREPITSKSPRLLIDPDRQGQAPEALLRDHPVAHVRAASPARGPCR